MATATSLGFSLFSTWDPKGARQARKDLTSLQKVGKDLGQAAQAGFGGAAIAVAAYGTALFKIGVQSNSLTQRVSMALKTTTGSAQAAQQQLAEIREFGKTSPIALPVWLKASQQMLAFGVEAGKVVPLLGAVQDAVVAAGGTEEEIKGVVRALSQMQSKGKLSAEELNQIGERGVDAAGVVAKAFGVSSQEIRAQITAGTLSVEDFFDGFVKGSKIAFGGAAQNAKQTFDGMIDRLKGAQRRIAEILVTPLINPNGGGAFVELGNALADAMNDIEDALRPLADLMTRSLEPSVDKVTAAIRRLGSSVTTQGIQDFFDKLRSGLPVISAVSAALSAKLASGFLELVPGMQRFAGAMSPVIFAIGALAATSPELRSALGALGDTVKPLIPVVARLATTVAEFLTSALKVLLPLVELAVDVVGFLVENWEDLAKAAVVAGVALYTLAAAQGVNTAATMLAAIGVVKLKDAFIALKAVMVAHPLLLIATVIAGIAAAMHIADERAKEAAHSISVDVVTAMSEATAAGDEFNKSLVGTGDDLQTLIDRSQNTVKAFQGIEGAIKNIGWDSLFPKGDIRKPMEILAPDKEDVQNYLDAAAAIDDFMAQLTRQGMDATAVQERMNEQFGITPEQLDAIKSELPEYLAAQIELSEQTQEVADKYGDATAALQGWGQELKAQTDPYFGLIKAQGDYNDALEKYNEIIADPEASSNDRTQAALALAEAMTGLRVAADETGTSLGEQLPPDFIAMAEAMNIPDSAIQDLQDSFSAASTGIIDSNNALVTSNANTAATVAEQMGLMSSTTADKAGLIAESLQQVAANHGDVDDAFYQMALRAGMTKDGVIDAMLQMREAGFDFSTQIDEYLDNAGTSHTDMADKTQTAGERMAEYLAGIRDQDVATSEASDEMRRRTNANMDLTAENMAGNTEAMGFALGDFQINLDGTWKKVKSVKDKIIGAWNAIKSATPGAWNSILSSIKGPVSGILSLYNSGIKPMWNAISRAMFNNKGILPDVRASGSRSSTRSSSPKRKALGGGITGAGTSTSDSIPALLSNGEYVIRAAAVNKYGKGTFDALNSMNIGPQKFALGGFVSNIASTAMDKVMSGVEKFGGSVSGWFGIADSVVGMVSKAKNLLNGIKGDSNSAKMAGMLKAGGTKAVGRLTSLVDQFNAMGFGGEGGPGNYQAMAAWIKKAVPGTIITSGKRNGTGTSYHNVGKAIDMAFTDGSERRGGGIAKTAYETIKRTWMNSILELIWDFSPDGPSVGIKNGRRHTYTGGSAGPGTHADHIHWANEGSGGSGGSGGGAGRWGDTVASVLRELGLYSSSHYNLVLKAIMKESSGNPNTVNTWDINAKNGTPSKGLLQTIDPTFYAWAGKYAGLGPFNPRANIYAAIRYAKNRYGSGWAARMARPGGYADGGYVTPTLYDNGGLLPPGVSLVENRTGVPEPVGHDLAKGGGNTYIVNINGTVMGNRRDIEDVIVQGLNDADKHGRLPSSVKNKK